MLLKPTQASYPSTKCYLVPCVSCCHLNDHANPKQNIAEDNGNSSAEEICHKCCYYSTNECANREQSHDCLIEGEKTSKYA